VITRAQIEQLQVRSMEELLQGTSGMAVGNNGGTGKLTSFFARGTDADHLLVLVDGVRIGSATAGTAALQNLPIEQVDRIEFVRGPRSSLYGSEAVGGVLQVFTRRGGAGMQPEFSASGGSFGTRQASASLGAGDAGHWFNVQGSWQSIDGFDACRGSSTLFAGCFTEEPDRDGYNYRSVSARGGVAIDGSSLEANFLRAASKVEYDGSFANRSEILQQVAGVSGSQKLGDAVSVSMRVARAWDKSDDFLRAGQQDTFQGDFNTTRDSASGQLDYTFGGTHLLSLGVDYLNDKVDSTTAFDVDHRHDTGVFAQYVGSIGAWRAEASLRHDDSQQFGAHRTGSLAVGYAFAPAWEVVAQYGTAFRAPTFNELYYPFFGNATLDPERSRSAELAVKGHGSAGRWRVSAFQTRVLDQIAFDANFLPANIDEARIRGIEAELSLRLGSAWQIDSGLTAMDPENRGDGFERGNTLPRRARIAGNLQAQWQRDAFSAGFRLVAQGHRYDDGANLRRLNAYATLDVQGEYRLAAAWRLQARVANVFDKRYETVSFYNQAGRAAYVTLRYSATH
jgi:vitamin B12 transporter